MVHCRAHRAPNCVARFRGRNRDGQHGRRIPENVTQLEIALHAGGKIEQQEIERTPFDVGQKLP